MGLENNDANGTTRRNRNRSWWQQRTSMERKGVIFFIIGAIIITALIIALIIVATKRKARPEDEVCNSPSCVQAASNLLKNLDQSIDPCDNFYDFVCGSLLRNRNIPDDKTEVGEFDDLSDLVQQQLRTIFEERPPENESTPFTWSKQFYSMCLDTASLEDITPIKELLRNIGGWPALDGTAWDERNFHWERSVYNFTKNGLSMDNFIKIEIEPDMKDSSRNIIYLDQAELEVGRENLLNGLEDEVVNAYYQYMVDLAVMFGAERAFAENEVKQMVEFKMQLANISASDEERRNKESLYHPMNISTLQQRYPRIYWINYLKKVLAHPELNLTDSQIVSVSSPGYFSKVAYLLDKTSKRAQANHAVFQAMRSLEWALPKSVRDREQKFEAAVFGTTRRAPRWKECATKTTNLFGIAAQALYVRKYSNPETKKSATEMITDIKNAFVEILENTKWMDEPTRKKAIEKAKTVTSHVAYSDEFLDDKKIEEYYSGLEIRSDNLLKFVSDMSVFGMNMNLPYLNKPVDKMDWTKLLPVTDVNAAYDPQANSIHLPACVLQSTVFDKNRLRAMNYGVMGFFIGHEITHGFDDQGRKFDKEGNLVKWWSPDVEQAFEKKAECIIRQYSNYTVPELGVKIDGALTEGENIADNGGVKEAYMAYNKWVGRNSPEPRLSGLNYTAKQLFWISAANLWCNKEKKASLESSISDVHSIGRFRVIGSFSNSDYFAKDFHCPEGSKMNPKQKCQVW